jgi:hypothetical protein
MNSPMAPKPSFRQIDPPIEMPLFLQQMSSGYGALSILILVFFISNTLNGKQGVQKNWRNFCKSDGLCTMRFLEF